MNLDGRSCAMQRRRRRGKHAGAARVCESGQYSWERSSRTSFWTDVGEVLLPKVAPEGDACVARL